MLIRFNKDRQYDYHNIIEIAWLFIVSELLEILIWFNAYDPQSNTINYRRTFWVVLIGLSLIGFCSLISITCISLLTLMVFTLL